MSSSVCIPNYNYGHYLSATLDSVLGQSFSDLEVLIADNSSTDDSVNVVEQYMERDERIRLRINNRNVGFARNLDRAASTAKGEWLTMLSSDDLLHQEFLKSYHDIIQQLGVSAKATILSTTQLVIDGEGCKTGEIGIDWKQWSGAQRDANLSEIVGADVYVLDAQVLLNRALTLLRTPFAFASTTYHRELYQAAEGYLQTAIINPDKKFAWVLLSKASKAVVIDKPLVSYRVHNRNQSVQQTAAGALKHLTDQYISTFDLGNDVLEAADLTRSDIISAFVEQDIILRSFLAVAEGDRTYARRAARFGQATFPDRVNRDWRFWALRTTLGLGPFGTCIASRIKGRQLEKREAASRQLGSGGEKESTSQFAQA